MLHPIRVAHVALQLQTGGMERLLAEFARHADRERVSLSFIALGGGGRVADEIASYGWPVTVLDRLHGLRPSTVFRLANLFRAQQIDIVHTHNSKPLLYAGSAARLAKVGGVIHTCHGRRQHATKRQNVAFRLACRFADRMVCVSQDIACLCEDQHISAAKTCTIPNGIDLQRFGFSGPRAGGPAVYVGRLSPEKDVPSLLRAIAFVVAQAPAFRLQIAGDGPCRAELISLARSLGVAENVEFLGEIKDIPTLLRQASLLVLPSLTEGMPLTILEAMACGLPVIATRVGGIPEAVADGATGLLVSPGELQHLADALLRIHHKPDLGRQMGQAGRLRAENQFDVRRMVSAYESLYLKLLQDRRALSDLKRAG
jgi:glycosyltransferase involved in cell wall biosynthesis